jgi:hypothetical protein
MVQITCDPLPLCRRVSEVDRIKAWEALMRRISIRGLIAFVVVFAIGLAALKTSSDLWAGMMLLVALAFVGVAILGAILMTGHERAWWLGFAVFEAGYLILTFGPWFTERIEPRLLTTLGLDYVHFHVTERTSGGNSTLQNQRQELVQRLIAESQKMRNPSADPTVRYLTQRISQIDNQLGSASLATSGPVENPWQKAFPGAANYDLFVQVGHSLFALMAGVLGGWIATWFDARRKRTETNGSAAVSG